MNGSLIAVVGASGAGKDSVLSASRCRLAEVADIRFVQRVITRKGNVGDEERDIVVNNNGALQEGVTAFAVFVLGARSITDNVMHFAEHHAGIS